MQTTSGLAAPNQCSRLGSLRFTLLMLNVAIFTSLKPLNCVTTHDDFRLPHRYFELLAKRQPPIAVQSFGHDFNNYDIIPLFVIIIDPGALGRGARKRRNSSKFFCKRRVDFLEQPLLIGLPLIIA